MHIANTYDIITPEGTTDDIINVVMMAYDVDDDEQIDELANELKGNTEYNTCLNIFHFLANNIRYEADVAVQEVKSPARLIHDGEGDCKSYSILTACVLRNLGIKHFFRFVSYSTKKEATHVYVVAVINNKELPIDAVAYVQAGKPIGSEIKYTYKADMATRTTKIAYLAGIQNLGIGAVDDFDVQEFLNSGLFDVWTDEDNGPLTAAKGYLLSEWDKEWTLFGFSTTNADRLTHLNRLQYVGAMLRFYNENYTDTEALQQAAYAFDNLITNRAFDSTELNPENRDFFSDKQNDDVLSLLAVDGPDTEFTAFWKENVVEANTEYDNTEISGIGSVSQIRTDLKKTGGYYLYTYIADEDISKFDANVYRKRLIQNRILRLSKDVLVKARKMTNAEIDNIVYSGCITTWGATPENTFAGLNNSAKVGIAITAILGALKVIASIIAVIVGIVKSIRALEKIDEETTLYGAPEAVEWNLNNKTSTGSNAPSFLSTSSIGYLIPALLLGGILLKKLKS